MQTCLSQLGEVGIEIKQSNVPLFPVSVLIISHVLGVYLQQHNHSGGPFNKLSSLNPFYLFVHDRHMTSTRLKRV